MCDDYPTSGAYLQHLDEESMFISEKEQKFGDLDACAKDPAVHGFQLSNDFDEAFVVYADFDGDTHKAFYFSSEDELRMAKGVIESRGFQVTVDTTALNFRRLHLYMARN